MAVRKIATKTTTRRSIRRSKKSERSIALPTTKTTPCTDLSDYSMLIYGEKKIGKTTLASHFGETLFCLFEPGGRALQLYAVDMRCWQDFLDILKLLNESSNLAKKFKTVVIDTADIAFKLCQQHVCERMGIDHPSDEEWGKGWGTVRTEFTLTMNKLLSLRKGVIFVSHSAEREVKHRRGGGFSRIGPTLPGQARDVLEGMIDIWAYYTYDGERRVLQIQGDDLVGAGHRIEGRFKTTDGDDLRIIPMGRSSAEAYRNFTAAFDNKLALEEPKQKKPKHKVIVRRRTR